MNYHLTVQRAGRRRPKTGVHTCQFVEVTRDQRKTTKNFSRCGGCGGLIAAGSPCVLCGLRRRLNKGTNNGI